MGQCSDLVPPVLAGHSSVAQTRPAPPLPVLQQSLPLQVHPSQPLENTHRGEALCMSSVRAVIQSLQ